MKDLIATHWKKLVGLAVLAAASYYGGPAAVEAVKALAGAVGW